MQLIDAIDRLSSCGHSLFKMRALSMGRYV